MKREMVRVSTKCQTGVWWGVVVVGGVLWKDIFLFYLSGLLVVLVAVKLL